MFSWFTTLASQDASREDFVDADGDGIDDNYQQWLTESRPTPISKTHFAHWSVAENNRQRGNEVRAELQSGRGLQKEMNEKYLDEAHVRALIMPLSTYLFYSHLLTSPPSSGLDAPGPPPARAARRARA